MVISDLPFHISHKPFSYMQLFRHTHCDMPPIPQLSLPPSFPISLANTPPISTLTSNLEPSRRSLRSSRILSESKSSGRVSHISCRVQSSVQAHELARTTNTSGIPIHSQFHTKSNPMCNDGAQPTFTPRSPHVASHRECTTTHTSFAHTPVHYTSFRSLRDNNDTERISQSNRAERFFSRSRVPQQHTERPCFSNSSMSPHTLSLSRPKRSQNKRPCPQSCATFPRRVLRSRGGGVRVGRCRGGVMPPPAPRTTPQVDPFHDFDLKSRPVCISFAYLSIS